MVLKIQVVGVQIVLQGRGGKAAEERRSRRTCGKGLRQVRAVVVDLRVQRRSAQGLVRPGPRNIAAGQASAAGGGDVVCAAVEVALYGQAVLRGWRRIEAESAAAHVPRIIRAGAGGRDFPVGAGVLAVSPQVNIGCERSADANAHLFLQLGACPRKRVQPPRDRKSTPLNSSHRQTSYAGFCLKKNARRASDHGAQPIIATPRTATCTS